MPSGLADHTATLLTDGRVLVAGGDLGGGDLTSATLLYDASRDSWSAASSLHDRRASHTATRLEDGRVLVVGGYRVQRLSGFHIALAGAEIYDPATGLWTPTASLAQARYNHTATLLPGGKVLVLGGEDLNGVVSGVELFDAVTATWSNPSVMATPRSKHTSTQLPNGEVLVVGGAVGGVPIAAADVYEPIRNRWSAAGTIGIPRSLHTATLMPRGTVLVAGGETTNSIQFLASTLRYAISTNDWRPAADMTSAHGAHVAVLLDNGLVLLVGGSQGPPELYDPVRDAWSAEGKVDPNGTLTALVATATKLADGSVLVIGGYPWKGSGAPTADVHRYFPDPSAPDTSAVDVPTLSSAALVALSVLVLLTAMHGVRDSTLK
jgi:N-acetylneuraminic acid mutarotase